MLGKLFAQEMRALWKPAAIMLAVMVVAGVVGIGCIEATDAVSRAAGFASRYVNEASAASNLTVVFVMAALFCGQVGMLAICEAQPNPSPLGARRTLGATSRGKTLAATLAASWLISFLCLMVAFLYIRFAVGIDFSGREGLCAAALAVAALLSTALGTLLGSLPKVGMGVKTGLLTALTCFLSLFAGLYGEPCMELADSITRNYPLLASMNPAKVVTDLFYSLYYYDSLAPFAQKAGILLAMAAVLFAVSALFVRRQRYASL